MMTTTTWKGTACGGRQEDERGTPKLTSTPRHNKTSPSARKHTTKQRNEGLPNVPWDHGEEFGAALADPGVGRVPGPLNLGDEASQSLQVGGRIWIGRRLRVDPITEGILQSQLAKDRVQEVDRGETGVGEGVGVQPDVERRFAFAVTGSRSLGQLGIHHPPEIRPFEGWARPLVSELQL